MHMAPLLRSTVKSNGRETHAGRLLYNSFSARALCSTTNLSFSSIIACRFSVCSSICCRSASRMFSRSPIPLQILIGHNIRLATITILKFLQILDDIFHDNANLAECGTFARYFTPTAFAQCDKVNMTHIFINDWTKWSGTRSSVLLDHIKKF